MHNLFLIWFWKNWLKCKYTARVCLIEIKVKLKFTCFSLLTNYYFVIESVHAFSFVNNNVCKALLLQGKCGIACDQKVSISSKNRNGRSLNLSKRDLKVV